MTALDTFEEEIIEGFMQEVHDGVVDPKIVDIINNRDLYDKYLDYVVSVNPKEHFLNESPLLQEKEVLAFLVLNIFGEKYIDDLCEALNCVNINDSNEILNGVNLKLKNTQTGEIINIIDIPSLKYLSSVVTFMHEFAHYLEFKYHVDDNKKAYYREILSIYIEKRTIELLEKLYVNKNIDMSILNKINETRLESISWHKNSLYEADTLRNIVRDLEDASNKGDIFAKFQLDSLCNSSRVLKTRESRNLMFKFYKNRAASYGLGYLYSEGLIVKRKDDSKSVDSNIAKVFKGEKDIQSLLDYYDINAGNEDIYKETYKTIDNIIKKR